MCKKMYNWGTHLFCDQWFFFKESPHKMVDEFPPVTGFQPVGLPHDWLIEQGNNLYEDSTGWYRKCMDYQTMEDRIALLRFDGVYMDSTIYVNRQKAGEWKYGYSCFEVDMTPWLKDGENEILVKVNHQSPNGRWYSGAGIYRDVWLKVLHRDRMVSDGLYASARKKENERWELELSTEVQALSGGTIRFYLNDRNAGQGAEGTFLGECHLKAEEDVQTVKAVAGIIKPKQWDIHTPVCYGLRAELFRDGEKLQTECVTIGFRTVEFDPDLGFLLNGRKVKLNGVCEHHDLGCLGAAYHSQAMRRKLAILKKMGVNAVRISHNMPSKDVMELADEMGVLIVSEAFDMWERPKNPYDYARFFPQWYQKDVASWVRRDRSHPSLIMWSIGNEIYDTHADERGQEVTRLLMEEVKKHDPGGNARVTIASNYMPWENARKCADFVKLAGYNYGEKYYGEHHRAHPDWIIYGSETASTVQSRGIYHFPYSQSLLADEDEQCSSLGNSTTSWGARSSESCIIAERDHPFSCGQFLWTGFDYIGEPTPYHTRNSYFGQVDTAGFPKDSYYLYQAEWTDYKKAPMVHVFPYWDFNDGQMIDVRICSNAPAAELFLNGVSLGKCLLDHEKGNRLTGDYRIPYEEGVLQALAYDEFGNVIAEDERRSFGEPDKICLLGEKDCLKANGEDLLFITVSMKDHKGNPVENANNRVFITVSGNGALVGLDNGDSTDLEEYKGSSRRLFGGKLLVVVAAGAEAGELRITAASPGMKDEVLVVPVVEAKVREGISSLAYRVREEILKQERLEDLLTDIPVRNIKLTSLPGTTLTKDRQTAVVSAGICPVQASDQTLIWSVVDDKGIPSKLAFLETKGNQAFLTANSDGHFRLRCMSKSGTEKIRILSTLEFTVEGIGETFLDPYEFVSGGLYDYSVGEVGNGNEKGVSTARDGETQVGFHNLNFGSSGSDEITIPIFALTGEPYRIRIYEGMPGEEQAVLIADEIYQKPSIWNVYQEETFHFTKKLRGVTSLCFVLEKKVHIKGFIFARKSRGFDQLFAGECDEVYGDHFIKEQEEIREIGNNVTIQFRDMVFGGKGTDGIQIWGYTGNKTNSILVRFLAEERVADEGVLGAADGEICGVADGETRGAANGEVHGKENKGANRGVRGESVLEQMLEFKHEEVPDVQFFTLIPVTGIRTVEFVFLPGSHFDFGWFQFMNSREGNRNM